MPAPRHFLGRLKETFLKIAPLGFIAFGGPGVHVVMFKRIFSTGDDPWVDPITFADLFSLSGALPGPGSTQLLFSIALVRGGALMGLFAFFLFSLPSAIGMFLLSLGVSHFPAVLPPLALSLLTGLNSAAVGLIFFAAYQLACMTITDTATRLVLFSTGAIASTYSAIWLFPVLTVAGGLVTLVNDWPGWSEVKGKIAKIAKRSSAEDAGQAENVVRRESEDIAIEELGFDGGSPISREASISISKPSSLRIPTPPPEPNFDTSLRRRTVAAAPIVSPPVVAHVVATDAQPRTPINFHLTIWQSGLVIGGFFALLISVLVVAGTISNPVRELKLFSSLLTAGTILFGGGPVVIPLLQGYFVTPGWVSNQDFLFGFAILQAFPGPNFNLSTYLGALALPSNPVLGAVLAYLGIFTPGIALKFALLPTYTKFRENKFVRSALRGLNAAASGLVWTAVFRLWKVGLLTGENGGMSLEKSGYWGSIAAGAFILSHFFKVQPPYSIVSGALLGVFYGLAKGAP